MATRLYCGAPVAPYSVCSTTPSSGAVEYYAEISRRLDVISLNIDILRYATTLHIQQCTLFQMGIFRINFISLNFNHSSFDRLQHT
ncbi:uncharacterized protein ASCRUDRAFT_111960 [Ascoidea rubescens DSM 1968]|uniref:Uncharacterized protein n=1 Tax=Ascoidea rubescens DSM 1968 TaxID=1344418 RepID=A0A1D2VCY2_9ASCO|nr:hypothetical protein ASCRUDRAFT_111960 [Ascoidea rubescens DSM 1968]ODV59363.1 hypothetical protein ASCRUDRAFT_111960 [Ascoidea rubescens DSM 1968]